MRFECELQLSYYKNPTYKPNKGKAHISLAKKIPQKSFYPNESSIVHYLIVSSGTGSRLHDTRYKLDDNILEVTKKFYMRGMTTVKLVDPPHSISISKANPGDVAKLVHILEMIQRNDEEFTEEFEPLSSMRPIKLTDLKPNPKSMDIRSKSKYPLTVLPQSLEKFTAVNVALVKFDLRFTRLKNLKELDLSHNKIKELPDCINEMVLTDLILISNSLQILPEKFGTGRLAQNLTNLNLSRNQISILQIEFYGFSELVSLDLSSNQLTELHPNLHLLQKLRNLKLDNNDLKSIPSSIFKMRKLNLLDITSNPFNVEGVKSNHGNVSLPSLFELAFRKLKSNPQTIKNFKNMIPPLLLKKLDAGIKCTCGKFFYNTYLTYYSRRDFDLKCPTLYKPTRSQVTMEIPLCTANCIRKLEQYKVAY